MKTDRSALIVFVCIMLSVPLLRDKMHPTSLAQVLIAIAISAACLGSAIALSHWAWKPLIARFGYYRACAIFCACLFCVLLPAICGIIALCSPPPFYRNIIGWFAASAGIGSWFLSVERKNPSPK